MKNRIFQMIRYSLFGLALLLPSQGSSQALTEMSLLGMLEGVIEHKEAGVRPGSLQGTLSAALRNPETSESARELIRRRASEVLQNLEYQDDTRSAMVNYVVTEATSDTTPGAAYSVSRMRRLYASRKGDRVIEFKILMRLGYVADHREAVRFLGEIVSSPVERTPMAGVLAVEGLMRHGEEGIEFLVSALRANRIQGARTRAQAGLMLRDAGIELPKG